MGNVKISIIIKTLERFLFIIFHTIYLYNVNTQKFKLIFGCYDLNLNIVIFINYGGELLKCMYP